MIKAINIDHKQIQGSWSILTLLIFFGILRLTNFNYYLSIFFGFDTSINSTGGDAFNFINYIVLAFVGLVLLAKAPHYTVKLRTAWPYLILGSIYLINSLTAPYVNGQWILYQFAFLIVAITAHFIAMNSCLSQKFSLYGFRYIFIAGVLFVVFCIYQILNQFPLSQYFLEYNDAFVQSLDDFGIMKQRFGYFAGFLLSYAIFIIKDRKIKIAVICIIFFACFGIRSFDIGLSMALIVFSILKPRRLLLILSSIGILYFVFLHQYFELLIYDTRYYSIINAIHIIQNFDFGVGLGGYPVYTEEFSRILFAEFYDVNSILDFIPTAPESDFVHILGSLGLVLGLVHLSIQFSLIVLAVKFQSILSAHEKCILFYFCFMSFYGISEDSIFSVNYWIFFGLSSGIVLSKLNSSA